MEQEKKAWLVLADGTVMEGEAFGAAGTAIGEVVFTTGMSGYQEVLTDPTFFGQIVTQTYPLIGNYGINREDMESAGVHVKGYVVREWCGQPSNFRAAMDIDQYLKEQNVVGICGIDTRHLTKKLRDQGVMNGAVTTEYESLDREELMAKIKAYAVENAVDAVTCKEICEKKAEEGRYKVALWDFGYKRNLLGALLSFGCDVTVFPAGTPADRMLELDFDGVVLSNGPGDPAENGAVVAEVKKLFDSGLPLFAVGLGHQLVAMANGAGTEKLKHGHRGANQPVRDVKGGFTRITAQNHGYVVREDLLDPAVGTVSHRNANDGTVEGIVYADKPAFTVQFHPDVHDTAYLFEDFIKLMKKEAE